MNSNYAILFHMTACKLMCRNIGSNVGIQTLKSQEFSIYQQLNLYCALPFQMFPYDFLLQNAVSYFYKCFLCDNIVSYVYIGAQILQYWFLCWLMISYVEILIHMLTFEFIYYNIGEHPKMWVQMLTTYKNWTKNSLYLIPLQIKNHRTKHSVENVHIRSVFPHSDVFLLRISPYSARVQEKTDQKNSEYGHFSRSKSDFKNCFW